MSDSPVESRLENYSLVHYPFNVRSDPTFEVVPYKQNIELLFEALASLNNKSKQPPKK